MMNRTHTIGALVLSAAAGAALAGAPAYTIQNLGVVNVDDAGSQGNRVSVENGYATGRSLGSSDIAFRWSEAGGLEALDGIEGRPYSVGNGVNSAGVVVGTGAQTFFGSGPLPIRWTGTAAEQLPLPTGFAAGRANDINDAGIVVGSVGGGISESAVIYGETTEIITPAAVNGIRMTTAFSINNSGLVVGSGTDANNAARNVGLVYDMDTGVLTDLGGLTGDNGALAFGVSDAGHVVGSSSFNQSSGSPFIWTEATGMVGVPLPAGTTQGSARGVNSDGWVVGTASSAFAVPFLFDGEQTYALDDLLPAGSGWDLATNTFSSALGISDDGVIVGTGVFEGEIRAYAMFPEQAGGCNAADIAEPFDVLDLADVQAFIAGFTGQDPVADVAEPFGVFDLADVQGFVASFVGGCP